MIVAGPGNRVLWAKRAGQDAWQFPQGGIRHGEEPEQALYRELEEELGLRQEHVQCLGVTRGWLRYRLPHHLIRRGRRPMCIGQKQKWFMLRLTAAETEIRFDRGPKPEFDHWRWVDYWLPLHEVVSFKQEVYRRALTELAPLLGVPVCGPSKAVTEDPILLRQRMRHFLVEITYQAPLPAIDAALAAHRDFLQGGYDRGLLLMSGPMTPRTGGVIIARGESAEAIETFFRDDPFKIQGLASYRIVEFTPVKHQAQIADWCLPKI